MNRNQVDNGDDDFERMVDDVLFTPEKVLIKELLIIIIVKKTLIQARIIE